MEILSLKPGRAEDQGSDLRRSPYTGLPHHGPTRGVSTWFLGDECADRENRRCSRSKMTSFWSM